MAVVILGAVIFFVMSKRKNEGSGMRSTEMSLQSFENPMYSPDENAEPGSKEAGANENDGDASMYDDMDDDTDMYDDIDTKGDDTDFTYDNAEFQDKNDKYAEYEDDANDDGYLEVDDANDDGYLGVEGDEDVDDMYADEL